MDILAAVKVDPSAIYTAEVVAEARRLRKADPMGFAALVATLRKGRAREVDDWARMLARRADPFTPALFDIGPDGAPRATLRNSATAIRAELEVDGGQWSTVGLDLFSGIVHVDGERVSDVTESRLAVWLDEAHGIRVSSALAGEALRLVAADRAYHPVRDYLDGLTWDGVIRTPGWLARYLGVPDSPLVQDYSRMWLISAVARVRQPGCKVDTVLALVGRQGAQKSTALRVLGGDAWFADTPIEIRDKDARQALSGVWVYEWAELEQMSRAESTAVKAFLSAQVDHYRPSYGRNTVDVPRQTVIVASTNEAHFLRDRTGSRRFWPVTVGEIDIAGLREVRDQLWAEAAMLYSIGRPWWLSRERDAEREHAADDYATQDPWTPAIEARLRAGPATMADLLVAVNIPTHQQRPQDIQRAGGIAKGAGAEVTRPVVGHGRKGTPIWRLK